MERLYNVQVRQVEWMFVKFKHTFCGLWHFCLKNNQQTCEKQILGLKFCAEFKRNNGLRLERGWEDIGVLWIIIIFFSFESGEMTVSKIEDWQTWSLWRKCSSQGRNKINCDCLLKKKKRGGRERACERVSCWRVVRWIGFLQLKHICFIECSQHYWSVFIVGPNALPEISAVTTVVHQLFSATFNTIFWGFRYLWRY